MPLGKVRPSTTAPTFAYKVPESRKASVNVCLTNTSEETVEASVYVVAKDDFSVSGVTVQNTGQDYLDKPVLVVSGDGTGAQAAVGALTVTSLSIANGGTGYQIGDTLTAVYSIPYIQVSVTATDIDGRITGFELADGGVLTEKIAEDSLPFSGGNGVGAEFSEFRYGIQSVEVLAGGNDYSTATVSAGGDGAGFTAVVHFSTEVEIEDAVEYRVSIPAKGVLERTGITITSGSSIFVEGSAADALNVFIFGVEAIA